MPPPGSFLGKTPGPRSGRGSRLFIDFHARLRGKAPVSHPAAPYYPLLHAAAEAVEPALVQGIQLFARYGRHRSLTGLYPLLKQVGYNEILRQFDEHQVAALVASMDRNGIEKAVVAAIEPFFQTLDLLEVTAPHAERFAVFGSVDPEAPDFAARFEAYVATGRIAGLKIHPAMAGPVPTSERMFELVGLAAKHQLPVLIHTGAFPFDIRGPFPLVEGANNVLALEPVIRAFPQVTMVLAHIGWDQHPHVLALGRDYPNVYTDTSWQPGAVIREALEALGAERVLFGSDFPLFGQEAALATVLAAVAPEDVQAVCYGNASRLLAHAGAKDGAARGSPSAL